MYVATEVKDADTNAIFDEYYNEMIKFRMLTVPTLNLIQNLLTNFEEDKFNFEEMYSSISFISSSLLKAIEILVFASIVNKNLRTKIIEKCGWLNIEDVIKEVELINPEWFPDQLKISASDNIELEEEINGYKKGTYKILAVKHDDSGIDKKTLIEHYFYVSRLVHYENINLDDGNDFSSFKGLFLIIKQLAKITTDLIELTKDFQIPLPGTGYMFQIRLYNNEIPTRALRLSSDKN